VKGSEIKPGGLYLVKTGYSDQAVCEALQPAGSGMYRFKLVESFRPDRSIYVGSRAAHGNSFPEPGEAFSFPTRDVRREMTDADNATLAKRKQVLALGEAVQQALADRGVTVGVRDRIGHTATDGEVNLADHGPSVTIKLDALAQMLGVTL
jgi:hypothetical protein